MHDCVKYTFYHYIHEQNLSLNVVKLHLFSHYHPIILQKRWYTCVKKVLIFVKKLHNCTQSGPNSVNVSVGV
jgi:hypothetical protein